MSNSNCQAIRDPGLLEELERAKGNPVYSVIERQVAAKQAKRDEIAALPVNLPRTT